MSFTPFALNGHVPGPNPSLNQKQNKANMKHSKKYGILALAVGALVSMLGCAKLNTPNVIGVPASSEVASAFTSAVEAYNASCGSNTVMRVVYVPAAQMAHSLERGTVGYCITPKDIRSVPGVTRVYSVEVGSFQEPNVVGAVQQTLWGQTYAHKQFKPFEEFLVGDRGQQILRQRGVIPTLLKTRTGAMAKN